MTTHLPEGTDKTARDLAAYYGFKPSGKTTKHSRQYVNDAGDEVYFSKTTSDKGRGYKNFEQDLKKFSKSTPKGQGGRSVGSTTKRGGGKSFGQFRKDSSPSSRSTIRTMAPGTQGQTGGRPNYNPKLDAKRRQYDLSTERGRDRVREINRQGSALTNELQSAARRQSAMKLRQQQRQQQFKNPTRPGGGGLFGNVETIPTSSSPNSLSGILQKSRSQISPGDMMHRGGV